MSLFNVNNMDQQSHSHGNHAIVILEHTLNVTVVLCDDFVSLQPEA